MAPSYMLLDQRSYHSAGPHLMKRDLSVTHAQAVTLGVMGAYVVVIALLWNLPYVRWSLWPFKVRRNSTNAELCCNLAFLGGFFLLTCDRNQK